MGASNAEVTTFVQSFKVRQLNSIESFMLKQDTDLIKKYKVSENIADEVDISEDMIWYHWNLERELTRQLLDSTPDKRWDTFELAYTRFYSELTWLSKYSGDADPRPPAERYKDWVSMIGPPPKMIYEVGSGSARMLSYLAEIGYDCKASDITRERQDKSQSRSSSRLSWGNSDGVHLDRFEPAHFYDVVVSDQVIEHFHPDDVLIHFESVLKILKDGGVYMFNTPHKFVGPHDVSQVFGCDEAQGMHLKEYTFRELYRILLQAGFGEVCYVIPVRLRQLVAKWGVSTPEQIDKLCKNYLNVMLLSERLLSVIPQGKLRRLCGKILKKCKIFKSDIFLAARRSGQS